MVKFVAVLVVLWSALWSTVFAQASLSGDQVWLQIEAQPDEGGANDRARAYGAIFPDVAGYRLNTNWYAIVLGPYSVAEGAGRLDTLLRENMIPQDSYLVDGSNFRGQFWPVEGVEGLDPPAPVTTAPLLDPEIAVAPAPLPAVVDETPQDARRSEAALSREERQVLQTALQWFGFYTSAIDGAFGPGTRNSMAAWQESLGLEPTGILTTTQRATLLDTYQTEFGAFGFAQVDEPQSGIGITLPLGLVEFDHYEPPFVHFREKNGSGVQVILISQPGDQAALVGLYEVLQSLTVVPLTGERTRGERSFSIRGTSATVESTTYAELKSGLIKGYMLITKPGQPDRDARILAAMQAGFVSTGSTALDPGMVAMDDTARQGLLAGLQVRKPTFSRTGFFIDASGSVLTTSEAVASCGRITLAGDKDADLRLNDPDLGIAVLTPQSPLSPPAIGMFQSGSDRLGSEVAVSGFSFEDRLTSPVLTYGTLEDTKGLKGEPEVKRLALIPQPGDAGGPIVDGTGAVLGMLLPRANDPAQVLPDDVAYAASNAAILSRLAKDGITLAPALAQGALAPEDLARRARDMTVLVSCWE